MLHCQIFMLLIVVPAFPRWTCGQVLHDTATRKGKIEIRILEDYSILDQNDTNSRRHKASLWSTRHSNGGQVINGILPQYRLFMVLGFSINPPSGDWWHH